MVLSKLWKSWSDCIRWGWGVIWWCYDDDEEDYDDADVDDFDVDVDYKD